MYFLFSEKTLKGFLCSVMWCQLFWCGQYFIFMGNVKNIFYCYFFPVRYKIFSNETSWCEVSSFSESRGHLLQISILQIRSLLSFFWIVAVTLWASCCFCKFVFKQSDAFQNLATFQFTQHYVHRHLLMDPDM